MASWLPAISIVCQRWQGIIFKVNFGYTLKQHRYPGWSCPFWPGAIAATNAPVMVLPPGIDSRLPACPDRSRGHALSCSPALPKLEHCHGYLRKSQYQTPCHGLAGSLTSFPRTKSLIDLHTARRQFADLSRRSQFLSITLFNPCFTS